jgi:undecaprenyl pyrophosphate phosphatase UppP
LFGAVSLGLALSLLVAFRHDWASILSAVLGRIFLRGDAQRVWKPDEQISLWIAVSSMPGIVLLLYGVPKVCTEFASQPVLVMVGLLLAGELVSRADALGKRQKGMFDWGIWDAFLLGLAQLAFLLPGVGRIAGMLSFAFFRGYHREPACRFILLASFPLLAVESILLLRGVSHLGSGSTSELSWLTFGVVLGMSFFLGLMSQGALQKTVARYGVRRSFFSRLGIVGIAVGFYALRDFLKL